MNNQPQSLAPNRQMRFVIALILSATLALIYGNLFALDGGDPTGFVIGGVVFAVSLLIAFVSSKPKKMTVLQKYAATASTLQTRDIETLRQEAHKESFLNTNYSRSTYGEPVVAEGIYEQLAFNLGSFYARGIGSNSSHISFLRIKLPFKYPAVFADGRDNGILFTKAKRAQDLQWFELVDDQEVKVLVRADPVLENSLDDILPVAMLRLLSRQHKNFTVELLNNELFIYFFEYQKPDTMHRIAEQIIAILNQHGIQTNTPPSPSVTLSAQGNFGRSSIHVLRVVTGILFCFAFGMLFMAIMFRIVA